MHKKSILIRHYKSKDFKQVWNLHNLALDQVGANLGNGPWDDDLKDIKKHYFQNGEFLIAEYNKKIIGVGAFKELSPFTAEIKRMRIHPDWQNQNIGTQILKELEKNIIKKRYKRIILDTTTKQISAQKFYEKHGYKEISRSKADKFTLIYYKKSLNAKLKIEPKKIKQITKVFPHEIKNVCIHDNGWDSVVYEINNTWMFKFARKKENIKQITKQKHFLKQFYSFSPLPVHKIEFEGFNFIGFKKFKGRRLTKEIFKKLDKNNKEKTAKQLGEFLSVLHQFQFKTKLKRKELSDEYYLKPFKEGNDEVFRNSLPKLPLSIQEKSQKYLSQFIQNKKNISFEKTIIHGDFSSEHIIFDEKGKKITGIIDFGDLCFSDPAFDFYALDFEKGFPNKILKYYSRKQDGNFRNRMDFYTKRIWFFNINSSRVKERIVGLKKIEKTFGNFKIGARKTKPC